MAGNPLDTLPVPEKPAGWVNDYEQLFTPDQADTLNRILAAFNHRTRIEIAIITIPGSWISADQLDSLVTALHAYWGLGNAVNHNGILMGYSKALHRIRITNGEGIVPMLSDADTKKIIDEVIIPRFKAGHFYEGTRKGLAALMFHLEKSRE